jgi:hypothetical protein
VTIHPMVLRAKARELISGIEPLHMSRTNGRQTRCARLPVWGEGRG